MKKIIIAALFATALTGTVSAQEKGNIELSTGIGFNSSTVSTSNFNADYGSGFNAGVAADFFLSDRWSIRARLAFDQKGWDNGFFEDEFGSTYDTNFNLNYLTVPVTANWHFGSKRNWYLNVGPYAGFLMSAKETEGGVDVKDAFNSTDFGLAFGIVVKIPVSEKAKIFIEYDGQSGFSDIFKESEGASVRNSRGSFNVGLAFLLK